MIISEHLCGIAIAYQESGKVSLKNGTDGLDVRGLLPDCSPLPYREQGSLINYQKRQVRNAVHFLAKFPYTKGGPLVFVATTSNKWIQPHKPNIRKFVHNLKNGYDCKNFVWVREFNGNGSPHYHFVADVGDVDPVQMSLYWSGLFGARARNSIRLGSRPDKNGRRIYRISPKVAPRMAFYMAKYFAKNFTDKKLPIDSDFAPGRKFGMSRNVAVGSQPIRFEANYFFEADEDQSLVLTASGQYVTRPVRCIGRSYSDELGRTFDKTQYTWRKHPLHQVYFGRRK